MKAADVETIRRFVVNGRYIIDAPTVRDALGVAIRRHISLRAIISLDELLSDDKAQQLADVVARIARGVLEDDEHLGPDERDFFDVHNKGALGRRLSQEQRSNIMTVASGMAGGSSVHRRATIPLDDGKAATKSEKK